MANKSITEIDYPISNRWLLKNCKTIWALPFFIVGFIVAIVDPKLFADPSVQTTTTQNPPSTPLMIVFFLGWIIFLIGGEYFWNVLRRKYFHYTIAADNLEVKNGIIAKQERHMPYNKLQNVFVKQDLLDRLFALKQVVIENAAGPSGALGNAGAKPSFTDLMTSGGGDGTDMLGNFGNSLIIPGLNVADAEKLKSVILERMGEHSSEDETSGL